MGISRNTPTDEIYHEKNAFAGTPKRYPKKPLVSRGPRKIYPHKSFFDCVGAIHESPATYKTYYEKAPRNRWFLGVYFYSTLFLFVPCINAFIFSAISFTTLTLAS